MSLGHDHKFPPVQRSSVSFVIANLHRIYSSLYQLSTTEGIVYIAISEHHFPLMFHLIKWADGP